MATIDPNQTFDIIHTLTFSEASGNCPIRLHRGSSSATSSTVYYRAGTSGPWTSLSVSGTDTTFPVTSTTMQVAHDWNKSGNNYMTPSFRDATNITGITISQKSFLTGTMGNYFMYYYAYGCTSLTSLDVPNTSGLTSAGNYFMASYAYGCTSLESLDVPDTSGLESVGNGFMFSYARDCSSLTSLTVPDTSGLTSVGFNFMVSYAYSCSSLTELVLPAVGWFEGNNVSWSVPADRLGVLKGRVLHSDDLSGWKALTVSGKTLYTNYIRDPDFVYREGYCEYVADLIRTIIQSQSYNADTERITLKDYSYSADTKRATIKEYTFTADTLRKLLKSYEYQADILRQVVKSYDYTADVLRRIAEEAEYQADAKRQIAKEYSYPADAERKILQDYDYVADTFRKVLKVYQYPADTVRKIVKEYEYIADTLRLAYTPLIITMSIQEREVKLGVEQMPLIGNTVILKAEFKDFDGNLTDIEEPKVVIYDNKRNVIKEATPTKAGTGMYYYDLVVPDYPEAGKRDEPLVFEFSGQLGGQPVVGRSSFERVWSE